MQTDWGKQLNNKKSGALSKFLSPVATISLNQAILKGPK